MRERNCILTSNGSMTVVGTRFVFRSSHRPWIKHVPDRWPIRSRLTHVWNSYNTRHTGAVQYSPHKRSCPQVRLLRSRTRWQLPGAREVSEDESYIWVSRGETGAPQYLSTTSMSFAPKKKTKHSLPPPRPVGLSDPKYAARRKSMFEFLNRMHALGCVPLPRFFATGHISVL